MKSFVISYVIKVDGERFSGTTSEWAASAADAEAACREYLEWSYASAKSFQIVELGVV